jgi:hypothetical protein
MREMTAKPKAKGRHTKENRAKADHEYGIGEMVDGTIDTFPPEELPARWAELQEMERAATGEDDLSDLDDIAEMFGNKAERA